MLRAAIARPACAAARSPATRAAATADGRATAVASRASKRCAMPLSTARRKASGFASATRCGGCAATRAGRAARSTGSTRGRRCRLRCLRRLIVCVPSPRARSGWTRTATTCERTRRASTRRRRAARASSRRRSSTCAHRACSIGSPWALLLSCTCSTLSLSYQVWRRPALWAVGARRVQGHQRVLERGLAQLAVSRHRAPFAAVCRQSLTQRTAAPPAPAQCTDY